MGKKVGRRVNVKGKDLPPESMDLVFLEAVVKGGIRRICARNTNVLFRLSVSVVACVLVFALFSGVVFAQTELVANGAFQSGSTGWVLSGNFFADLRFTTYHNSPGYAYLSNSDGSPGNSLVGSLYQTVTIPSTASSATLSFWYNITSQETGPTAFDVLNVTIQNNTGGFLATVAVLSNLDKGTLGVYSQRTFDMTPFKGQTVRINFR